MRLNSLPRNLKNCTSTLTVIHSHFLRLDSLSLYISTLVYSGDLTWHSKGDQENELGPEFPIPVQPDILIAKLRPGQVGLFSAMTMKVKRAQRLRFTGNPSGSSLR